MATAKLEESGKHYIAKKKKKMQAEALYRMVGSNGSLLKMRQPDDIL